MLRIGAVTSAPTLAAPASSSPFADALAVARYHIVLVAMTAAVVFGWLMTGRYPWAIVPLVGLDWFLINLMNRVTDIDEDTRNGIRGTARVARHKRALTVASFAVMIGSIAAVHAVLPGLTPYRVAVHVIGLGYNYDIVPTPRGLSRFKEIYFFKNFGSSVLFVLTCFAYPLAADAGARTMPWAAIVALVSFFVPFELTYEILYDLRDLKGDRAEGIPTYPVVHGVTTSRKIIDGLLILSSAALVVGIATRGLGVREALMLVAPGAQLAFYRPRLRRGLTPRDCIVLTHLGTAQLVLFLVGTAIWRHAGLPGNVFL
ncbi:UbiA prenyltransferase family protein [Minicystis rosea]|nr:UbiA prenyltransferase family protein [Minicystis rosea]